MLRYALYHWKGKDWNNRSKTQQSDPDSFACLSRLLSSVWADFLVIPASVNGIARCFSFWKLTKWQAVSKVVNKLSKTNVLLCLFGSRLCKNLEVPGFTESVAQTSVRFVLQTPLTCHRGVVLLLPSYCWAQVCELLCRFRGSSLLFLCCPSLCPCTARAGLHYTCS